jgi:hypothetical protein
MSKLFNFPIKTFTPDNLMEEMLNAKDGEVFIIGEQTLINPEGRDTIEITMVQIRKIKEPYDE